ncbi:MAG: DUF4332 domain-containing protein [Elainellaceae cyanobacterium]
MSYVKIATMPELPTSDSYLSHRRNHSRTPATKAIASQSWLIANLPGMSDGDRKCLNDCKIETTQQLLTRTHTAEKQQELATQLKMHPQYLKKWIALANLSRIPTVGCEHCGVLLHAGIISPDHLARTPLPRLHQQIVKLHVAQLRNKDQCPSLSDVRGWQHQARQLQPF